jgi:hypothetical protein
MNKRLGWIAAVSFSIAAACGLLGSLVASLAGGDYRSWAARTGRCVVMPWAKKAAEPGTADLAWSGSDVVKIRIPARVHYQPGPTPQATVSGDAELVSHVRMRDGTLEWDTIDDCFPAHDLVVQLSGPAVPEWTMSGSAELDLADIKQDALRITTHGSGTVTASGEVHAASLHITGSGRANLSRLVAQQVSARTSGSADVDLAPRDEADISISGSAVVRLHGTGARIRSRVSGSGQIKQLP